MTNRSHSIEKIVEEYEKKIIRIYRADPQRKWEEYCND